MCFPGIQHLQLNSSRLDPLKIWLQRNNTPRSQILPTLLMNVTSGLLNLLTSFPMVFSFLQKETTQMNIIWFIPHRITELSACKNMVIVSSSLCTKKRYIGETTTTVNNLYILVILIILINIQVSNCHDLRK